MLERNCASGALRSFSMSGRIGRGMVKVGEEESGRVVIRKRW